MNVVKVMVWIPENLFCVGQRSDLLGLPYFFFPLLPFFLSLGNTNLHLCKPEKVRPMGLC